jgi:GntR family transcriptional regulator, transcriptional repressor for pyruvate dehydrogenase complex
MAGTGGRSSGGRTDRAILVPVSAPIPSAPVRAQRVAELVAQRLRERILRGELSDGEMLPKEDDLRAEYPVSKPSLREALRILETEGLITVMRGNKGGALVHRPTEVDAGYMLGLVLTGQGTEIADLAAALREIEPACAALCAARRDRKRAVVPVLVDLHEQALTAVDDLVATTTLSRRFHETIVELCGNRTLTLVAGALESLWSSHERRWAEVVERSTVPVRARRRELAVHGEIVEAIRSGDSVGVRALVAHHLRHVQQFPATIAGGRPTVLDPSLLHR